MPVWCGGTAGPCCNQMVETRPCSEHDLAALATSWPEQVKVHEAHFAAQQTGQSTFLVAWKADEATGYCMVQWGGCVGPNARSGFPNAVEINHLQVRPAWQRLAVGTQLIAAAEALLQDRGIPVAALGVGDDNPGAARLYARLGYRPTDVWDVTEYDWDDGGTLRRASERTQLMVKAIGLGQSTIY